jgi:hypothetical protein
MSEYLKDKADNMSAKEVQSLLWSYERIKEVAFDIGDENKLLRKRNEELLKEVERWKSASKYNLNVCINQSELIGQQQKELKITNNLYEMLKKDHYYLVTDFEQLELSLEQSKSANKRIKEETKYIDYNRLLDRFNRQKEQLEQFEKLIGAIANIDGAFITGEGECDYTDKQALDKIMEWVDPVWDEIAQRRL